MEADGTAEGLTKTLDSPAHSAAVSLKLFKIDDCSNNQCVEMVKQSSHPEALSLVRCTKTSTERSYTNSNITVTLENESVWSRFHSLGTEMILTKQGRRMFPCCRFKMSGLDPNKEYVLVMDIIPLDTFIHKWNGMTWEPCATGEPHVPANVCVHPESPALGEQWMESPVSFYKVKLTNTSTDQEGCVLLHPMHRYQPRLHIVPVNPESKGFISLDSPNVQMFMFPKTEFYAVTKYQNPQITQLKIDCNPFAMAFRKDNQSIRLLQDKFGFCNPGGPQTRPLSLNLASYTSEQNGNESVLNNADSPCIIDNRGVSHCPGSPPKKAEGILIKMRNVVSGYLSGVALCKEDVDCSENEKVKEVVVKQPSIAPDVHVAPLDVEPVVTTSIQDDPQNINGHVPLISNTQSSEPIPDDAGNSQISFTHEKSSSQSAVTDQIPQSKGRQQLSKSPYYNTRPENKPNTTAHYGYKPFRRAKKPKSKWWSNIKYSKPPPVIPPLDVSLRPDLEDVDGMLFVAFAEKEALDIHVQNMKPVETPQLPSSETQHQLDTVEVEDLDASLSIEERISKFENILLLHLKQQKHRQVIHPLLQEVGMKLSLLDPTVAIDLQYLGVRLPFPPPIVNSLDQSNSVSITSSHGCSCADAAGSFVSRTGKTNDLTKIKGWRDRFNTEKVQNAPEGMRNSSAFCSDLLDEYLENEAQQITDRAAVFSSSSSTPVSYQTPAKSSSYVVTLDSLLKNRSTPLNRVYSTHVNNIQNKTLLRTSPKNVAPFSSEEPHSSAFENRGNSSHLVNSYESDQAFTSTGPIPKLGTTNQSCKPQRCSYGMTPAKMQLHCMLQDIEEEAIILGKPRTHITTERANFALCSLLTSQKSVKRIKFSTRRQKDACPEDFCQLGCICDSLQRKIRGPTHCRRVQCMFDCNCFKHKVLLIHPSKVKKIQRGRKRALMAFPVADPEKGDRPPPATSVTTLWKWKSGEQDPEPLFVPEPALPLKRLPCNKTSQPVPQIREEDKDPVYIYFESMMTCARVREYNSNPPPQLHMFPIKRSRKEAKLNHGFEAGGSQSAIKEAEKITRELAQLPNSAPTSVTQDEPEPTKLLEILSECNWEPHRNMVLTALFRHMNNNLFSEPFCVGMYKVQLLSTTLRKRETCTTIIYKVCVSRAEEENFQTPEENPVNKVSEAGETQIKRGNDTLPGHIVTKKKSSPLYDRPMNKLPYKNLSKIFPLATLRLPAGYLKAAKKKPGGPAHGLIKVNGKTYNQAKLLLGQMGALNPANRFAAFITGRLQSKPQDHAECESSAVHQVTSISKMTPSGSSKPISVMVLKPNADSKETSKSKSTPLTALSNVIEQPTSLKEQTPLLLAGSKPVSLSVPPSSSAGAPSAETHTSGNKLPPGQQVVLQHLPGVPGSNFVCQYNGQIIQLVPIAPRPVVQPQPSLNQKGSTPQVTRKSTNTCQPMDFKTVQKPLDSTSSLNAFPKPLPVLSPKMISLSGCSGMNIASGTPAFNVQSSFPGKTGTFSFRICPPNTEGTALGSQKGAKPLGPLLTAPSTLILPGGFTLIKLPLVSHTVVPTTSADVPTVGSLPEESRKDKVSQDSSLSTVKKCQVSESNAAALIPKTSNNNSAEAGLSDSSQGNSALSSNGVEVELKEDKLESADIKKQNNCGKYDWIPKGTEMILKSDEDCELEHDNMEDWPPKGAEQVLWSEESSIDEEKNEDIDKQLSKNSDISPGCPADKKSKTLKTSIDSDPSNCDSCRYIETDKSECYQTHGNFLPPEPSAIQQEKVKSNILDDPVINLENNIEKVACFNDCSVQLKQEPNNKTAQISSRPCIISKKGLLQENGSPAIQTELPEGPTQDMVAKQSNSNEQSLGQENSSSFINKKAASTSSTCAHTLSNHVDRECGTRNSGPGNNKPATNKNPTKTLSSPDHATQHMESNGSEVHKNRSLFSSSLNNTGTLQHAAIEENDCEDIDIEGDVPCTLLEGQTPARSSPPIDNLPKAAKITDPENSCRRYSVVQKSSSEGNKVCKHSGSQEQCVDEVNKMKVCVDDQHNDSDSDHKECTDDDDDDTFSDEDGSSYDSESTGHSKSTDESANISSKEDDAVDIESFDENQEKRIIGKMKAENKQCRKVKQRTGKRTETLRKQSNQKTEISEEVGSLPANEMVKRLKHTEKERVRRGEMRQSFASLKTALNVEDQIRMCTHDILIQARLMIRALEDRSRTLEERKKALLQRQSAYMRTIAQLSGKTEELVKKHFKEHCEQGNMLAVHNLAPASVMSPVNSRQVDCEGKRLPPLHGQWRSNNCRHKKPNTSPGQPSVTHRERKKKTLRTDFIKEGELEGQPDLQNLGPAAVSSPQINPRRLDSEGNQLPPRLGLWKSANYIRKRCYKPAKDLSITTVSDENSDTSLSSPVSPGNTSTPLSSVNPGDIVLKLVAQNPNGLPTIPNTNDLSAEPGPTGIGLFSLPKIVLQSFGKADTVEKHELTSLVKTVEPKSPQASESADSLDVTFDRQEAGTKSDDNKNICVAVEKLSGSEESNKEYPSASPPASKNPVQEISFSESEKKKSTPACVVKPRKKRAKNDAFLEDALSNLDILGPRMLRNRSPATNRMSTRSTPSNKRQRII
ncbi:MAX gene-associated protein isoform X2 [Hoplias malabaricus]|uniref:MAX gene-associated protein isoform X2 n=1 Tax=Hoplias malabaricus TaxID=27720 RepID=UPI0034628470